MRSRTKRGVDTRIDDQMRNVNVFRTKFARHALRGCTQAGFGARKRRIADAAANASGRAGKEMQPLPRGSISRPLRVRSGTGMQLIPDLAKHALGRSSSGN